MLPRKQGVAPPAVVRQPRAVAAGPVAAIQAHLLPGQRVVQRMVGPGVRAFPTDLRPRPGGQAIPAPVREKLETALGHDFSDVRVHVGNDAPRIGAIAFTWGTQIHFAPGQYQPHTLQGQKLLAHELTHVVQQKQGRVRNPFGTGVAVVQDRALEAEAERAGNKLTS